jgi:transcriptional regulator with XRE-family HTH domain
VTSSTAVDLRRRGASAVGELLKQWRRIRRKSQLDLALDARVTQRHVSFVETGRANPSREMLLTLADALDIPFRARNDLFLAAGYAPVYRETNLEDEEMSLARFALDRILEQHEPFPAVVMDRRWNLVRTNRGAERLFGSLIDLGAIPPPANVLRLMFDPRWIRPAIANWQDVAHALIQRVHREAVGGVPEPQTLELLEELLGAPGVPADWRQVDVALPLTPVIPIEFRAAGETLRYFSMVTTLGTPVDITLQELRIESFFPGDASTEEQARRVAVEGASRG